MFERFTEDARNIVVLAQREARTLNHNYIGSEALLLGLVLDLGIVGQALAELEITYEAVTGKIIELVGRWNVAPEGHSPFTPRARTILQQANEISLRSGHGYIGPEHLIFALLEAENSVACRVLTALGAKPGVIRRLVGAHFARSYTGGGIFQGFTAVARDGRYDTHPLRETAEEAAADAAPGVDVCEIRFGLERNEYFVCLEGGPVEGIGRYLDYNRARSAAAAAGARVYIVSPQVKAVTAETASGIEVTLAETIVWEPVPLESRITVLS
ncbi:MAG TPA: Clp protease N-terminal domain-containing protein [Arthrobacter sp.]